MKAFSPFFHTFFAKRKVGFIKCRGREGRVLPAVCRRHHISSEDGKTGGARYWISRKGYAEKEQHGCLTCITYKKCN